VFWLVADKSCALACVAELSGVNFNNSNVLSPNCDIDKFSGVMSSPAEGVLGEHGGVSMGNSISSDTVGVSRGTLKSTGTVGVSRGTLKSTGTVFVYANCGQADKEGPCQLVSIPE